MVSDFFGTLLQELGESLKIKDLHLDEHNSCLIKFPSGLEIQVEPDSREEFLVIGTTIGVVPAGRYRETIFREALKANSMPLPRYGVFAFSTKTENLILFDTLHMKDLTGTKVFDHLSAFAEKALTWKEALSHGDVPSIHGSYSGTHTGMFGMKS
jgi:hypothetical protein